AWNAQPGPLPAAKRRRRRAAPPRAGCRAPAVRAGGRARRAGPGTATTRARTGGRGARRPAPEFRRVRAPAPGARERRCAGGPGRSTSAAARPRRLIAHPWRSAPARGPSPGFARDAKVSYGRRPFGPMRTRSEWLVLATLAGAAGSIIAFELGPSRWAISLPAHDVYAYFYPNMLYALQSLQRGGRGLLWNPFQNCGQPFFANSQTGLLYPANALFLVLGPDAALRGVLLVNLLVAGISTYLLCREIGA